MAIRPMRVREAAQRLGGQLPHFRHQRAAVRVAQGDTSRAAAAASSVENAYSDCPSRIEKVSRRR